MVSRRLKIPSHYILLRNLQRINRCKSFPLSNDIIMPKLRQHSTYEVHRVVQISFSRLCNEFSWCYSRGTNMYMKFNILIRKHQDGNTYQFLLQHIEGTIGLRSSTYNLRILEQLLHGFSNWCIVVDKLLIQPCVSLSGRYVLTLFDTTSWKWPKN